MTSLFHIFVLGFQNVIFKQMFYPDQVCSEFSTIHIQLDARNTQNSPL